MTSHALLSPSAAHRWMRCPGSVAFEATLPDSTSSYAEWGTAAHQLASDCLTAKRALFAEPRSYLGKEIKTENMTAPVVVDGDMASCVERYIETVGAYAGEHVVLVEQKVDFSENLNQPGSFGTADCVVVAGEELQIHDLKTGMGVRVDAVENEQLMLYALGALNAFGFIHDIGSVRLVIHQPRLDHVSDWTIPAADLVAWASTVKEAAKAAVNPGAPFAPGEKQCRFCKAKAHCKALADHVADAVSVDFEDLQDIKKGNDYVAIMDLGDVGTSLAAVDLIEQWCAAIRARAFNELSAGNDVPGFKLVEGRRGARGWTDGDLAEATLKRMKLKVEEMYDLKVISPTTAEKLAKAGTIGPKQWPGLQAIITQADGKPSVAPISDKRPAITVAAVADEFRNVA